MADNLNKSLGKTDKVDDNEQSQSGRKQHKSAKAISSKNQRKTNDYDGDADNEEEDDDDENSKNGGNNGIQTVSTSQYELLPLHQSVKDVLSSTTAEDFPADGDITKDKLEILENAKKSAVSTKEKAFQGYEDSSDSQDCMTCFKFRKKKRPWKEVFGAKNKLIRWIIKWIVFIIALGNFVQSLYDTFNLLQYQMKFDYFFAIGVYNCNEWVLEAYNILLFVYTAHGLTSVILLFGNSKSTATFTLYWIGTQVLLNAANILEGFFKYRFSKIEEMTEFLVTLLIIVIVDIIEIAIILLRFYLLDRPYQLRLKRLAASARLDRTLNGELFLRASMFLQRKSAIREAANFQILAVIKKLREEYNSSGMRASPEIVLREVQEALNALKDQSKYPGLKRLKQAEKARRRLSEFPQGTKLKKPLKIPKPEDRKKSFGGNLLGSVAAKKSLGGLNLVHSHSGPI